MLFKLADHTNPDSTSSRLRQHRLEVLFELIEQFPNQVRVLDVGGTPEFWRRTPPKRLDRCQLTLLNLTAAPLGGLRNAESLAGDARNLFQFPNRSFDVCFSNSVIEHVGNFFDQQAMAREIARVSRAYFVQTPNRYFPLEPHFHVPFWPFLPVAARSALHRWMNLGWIKRQPHPMLARAEVEQIRLLSRKELAYLFPNAEIKHEKFAGLTKSFFVIQHPTERFPPS